MGVGGWVGWGWVDGWGGWVGGEAGAPGAWGPPAPRPPTIRHSNFVAPVCFPPWAAGVEGIVTDDLRGSMTVPRGVKVIEPYKDREVEKHDLVVDTDHALSNLMPEQAAQNYKGLAHLMHCDIDSKCWVGERSPGQLGANPGLGGYSGMGWVGWVWGGVRGS